MKKRLLLLLALLMVFCLTACGIGEKLTRFGKGLSGSAVASVLGRTFSERYDETLLNPFPYTIGGDGGILRPGRAGYRQILRHSG